MYLTTDMLIQAAMRRACIRALDGSFLRESKQAKPAEEYSAGQSQACLDKKNSLTSNLVLHDNNWRRINKLKQH
jgi:hypothetical protein